MDADVVRPSNGEDVVLLLFWVVAVVAKIMDIEVVLISNSAAVLLLLYWVLLLKRLWIGESRWRRRGSDVVKPAPKQNPTTPVFISHPCVILVRKRLLLYISIN